MTELDFAAVLARMRPPSAHDAELHERMFDDGRLEPACFHDCPLCAERRAQADRNQEISHV